MELRRHSGKNIATMNNRYLDFAQTRDNNLRYQHGDMHIAATVTFARIYDKITKVDNAAKTNQEHKTSILVLSFTANAYVFLLL